MMQQTFSWFQVVNHAVLSEDRVYRYELYRSLDGLAWDASLGLGLDERRRAICFIMLNPSTADENDNDPTILKLMKFGRKWGYDRLSVANLFAYRETDSKKLRSLASRTDLVGPENDQRILKLAAEADQIVVAWGKEGDIQERGQRVLKLLRASNHRLWCLRKNLDGSPVHPLYQADAAELVEF